MNKIYKVIWSKVKHQYVVVSELAHRDGKRSSAASKSVRTLLAVLAVCGMYGIQNSYAAEGTTTLPYQYVATGQASIDDATSNNSVYVERPWWQGGSYWTEPTEYYKDITVGDKTYRYVYTEANDGKAYWVREGYSINIVEDERFTGADPDTVIQYHKEDPNADDSGLVQSFQNVDKNLGVTTAHGDTLWSTSTGVYAGAVNSPTTEVTSGIPTGSQGNQFVINNGTTTVGKSTFTQYFREVNYNSKTGEYMYNGNPVDMSALRVVDGQIGVFLTKPNGSEVYTGDVFGVHNEILMTGTNENGDLVSYWGAEDIDPMAPIGSMPKYLFDEKFEKIDNDLVALHKDDIKEIQVSETSGGNGGTLGLIRNGGRAVDGAVTVTSTGGTDGNDVKVQFSNDWTDKEGVRHSGSFTVDAGSKVVGKVNNNGATVDANPGDTLTSIDINGQNYKLGGGKTYTAGNNINIDDNNVISTTKTTVSVDDNFTVTPTTDEAKNITDYNIKLNNVVTVGSGEKSVTIDGENGQVTGLTNTSLDVAGFAETNRAATEEQLDLVRQNALDLNLTNITDNGKKVIKGLEQHITPGEYEVQADGTVTMTYVDGNGQTVQDQTAKITGIATDAAVKAAKTEVVKGTNIASVTESTGADGQTVYTVNAEGAKVSADDNFTVTPTTDKATNVTDYNIKLNNVVTVGSGEKSVTIDGENGQVTGLTNTSLDVAGFAESNRAATEEQLDLVRQNALNLDLTNITDNGKKVIKGLEQHITPGEYEVQADGTVTMTYVDGNGQTVQDQTAKITGIATDAAVKAAKTTVSGSNNISAVGTQQTDGHTDYNVKLNDNVYLGGNQTAGNSNIALEGSTGSIHAATTEGNHTFDFNSNGGKFETTTVNDSLLVDMPIIGKNGVVTTTTNTSEFNQRGATFTKTGKTETYVGDHIITTTPIPKTFTNIDGSKITSDAGVLGGQTVVDGGSVTVQGAGSVLGTHTTTVEGSKITSVGTWGSLLGDTTEIDGAYINAGGIEVNGEPLRDTITGLSNTEWKNDEAWQKTHIRDDRAATEGQLQDVADSLSGDVSKLDDFAVKYDEVNGKPDYSTVTLEGTNGTKITNLAKGEVTATSTDAVNGSQLFEVQELAGKHTTMTVNNGMAAPEDDSYTTDGNLQLKQKVGDKGQIEYDVKLSDDIVLSGSGESKEEQDNRVTLSGTNGTIMATTNFDDMSATTTINGGNVYVGSSVSVGDTVVMTDKDITGLTNTTWKNDAAWQADNIVADRAATEGQLQTVADTVNAGWTATDDADNKINVNPKDHPTLNFASGKNVTVSAADGEISVSLNDEVKLGDYDNGTGIYLSGASGTISATNSISVGEDLVIDGNKKTVNGLSNKTWSKDSFVSGQAATEDQLDAMADWTETQVNNSGWTASTNGGKEDEKTEAITNGETVDFSNTDGNIKVSQDVTANGTSIKFNLNDDLLLGANADEGAGINLSGTAGEIAIKSANGSTINIGNGVITGLTNTVSNENWETFMNSDLGNNGSRAVTEDDLQLVAQHSVQYKTNDDGTIDYNNIFLSGASYSSDGHTGGTMITNVAYASDSDGSAAVNVDKLHDAISDAKTEVTNADKHLNYDKTYSVDRETNKVNLEVVDNQGNVVGNTTIEDVASATDVGNIGDLNSDIAHDSTGDGNVSIVDAVNNVDNKVGDLKYKHDDGSDLNYVTAGDSVTGAIGDLDAAIKDAATEAGQHSSVSGSDNITVAENGTNGNGGTDYKVSLNDDLTLGGKEGQNGSIAITGSEGTITASGNVSAGSFTTGSITINGANEDGTHTGTINGLSNKTWDANNIVSGQAATEDQLKAATEGAVQYDRNEDGTVNKGSITLGGSTYNEETHEGGTTITNVADGKNASDAVNMSQLWQTNQAVINNSNNIQSLSNQVGKLDNRIDEVGAGAAALAALHPLDFDPDDKWDFSAGYGNYRGESAVAVGAFYRPNEDTMFSVGGTVGNGDNMVNAGVSFKIGQGNSVSTSRVAMAKEIKSMRDIVAKQDAQIQKLTAMVNALVGIQAEPDTTTMFPDVPENHWAYEAVEAMAKSGLVKGYPDGEFKGDRTMTRYEFAQIVYNAIQAGAEVDARLVQEFQPELQYFRVDTVAQDKNGNPTIQRVRVNDIPVQQ